MSPSDSQKSTSVFHALGSYADRIKEQRNGKAPRASTSHSPSQTSNTTAAMSSNRDAIDDESEGSWETVRTGRNKTRPERQEEKRGSNSRNWRDRGGDDKSESTKGEEDVNSSKAAAAKKDSPPTATPTSRAKSADPASSNTEPAPVAAPKPAWGAASLVSPIPTPIAIKKEDPSPATSSTSAEAPLTSKASTKKSEAKSSDADAEGSWRARPKHAEAAPSPVPQAPAKAAPPPSVNAWNLRKPAAAAPPLTSAPTPAQASSAASTSTSTAEPVPAAHPNGESAKSSSKKSKKKAEPPSVADSTLWPDVVQATKVEDMKAKKGAEAAEDAAQGVPIGKKQKWKAIPATELQEAADKVAETSRRQAKQKQKQTKGETESVESKSSRGKKQTNDGKKAPRMQRSASQGSEIRSHAEAARANGFRDAEKGANGDVGANGASNAGRQTSHSGSKRNSPSQSNMPLSPEQRGRESSSTGTLPQHGFHASASLPRPPRGRDREGRGGYAARGRGNYRSASNAAMQRMYGGELSPLGGNASLYPASYGVSYGGFYPMPAPGYVLAPGFDASQGTYNGVPVFPRGMPPPPMPVTQVVNIDPQRFYVLGQVEYYFSMQNLAMDFFLRQQMDAEGWIDVAMIASFNRVKSLTPDVAVVREVMVLSSLLEVSGDKVRLAGAEAKRWVLPDAKPSGPANLSPKKGEANEISHGIPMGVGHDNASALGMEDMGIPSMPTSPVPKFDVENALMKSSGSANVSSTASVLASEEGKTATPATSVTDEIEKSENEEEK